MASRTSDLFAANERLRVDNAGLRADLEGEANWDLLCSIADRLNAITGAPVGMSLPEQVEHGLMSVERLRADDELLRAYIRAEYQMYETFNWYSRALRKKFPWLEENPE